MRSAFPSLIVKKRYAGKVCSAPAVYPSRKLPMPSSDVPPSQPFFGRVATTGLGSIAGMRPSHAGPGDGGGGVGSNVASTSVSAPNVTMQLPAPEHASLQAENLQPSQASAIAVSVTCWPAANVAAQGCPHLMPPGVDFTVPVPWIVTRNT